jgi:arylsulfatase A-like enzyme
LLTTLEECAVRQIALLGIVASFCGLQTKAAHSPPNFVLLLCDNLGYGDVGCYGSTRHRTPHIDRMAAEGLRLTHFYVTSGVCTPSRASLMTGCYPRRVNLHESDTGARVLQPVSPKGLHPDEVTLAEVLRSAGYATCSIGKWHLGDQPEFLPTRQGFDEFFGIPYSDDMTPREGKSWPPLPLMRNEQVVEAPADRNLLTRRYTEEAIAFMEQNRERRFFLYLPHAMPGSTTAPFASEAFRGQSANGPYGDAVEELDWSTGEILAALKRLDLDDRTLVVWTSDNGAVRRNPPQGSNAPLAGWGYDTSEGAMRMPCILRWPGRVPAGATCAELCTSMDFYVTFARLAAEGGAEAALPRDGIIDGKDAWSLWSGRPGAETPYEAFYFYAQGDLRAVRSGPWKLYLPTNAPAGTARAVREPMLYDLVADVSEERDMARKNPDIVQRLSVLAEAARQDLGDGEREGANQRPAGWVEEATARVIPAN